MLRLSMHKKPMLRNLCICRNIIYNLVAVRCIWGFIRRTVSRIAETVYLLSICRKGNTGFLLSCGESLFWGFTVCLCAPLVMWIIEFCTSMGYSYLRPVMAIFVLNIEQAICAFLIVRSYSQAVAVGYAIMMTRDEDLTCLPYGLWYIQQS